MPSSGLNQHFKPIRVRDLDRLVQLHNPDNIPDQSNPGNFAIGWKLLGDYWAKITPLSGKELMFAGKLTGTSWISVIIRYDPNVDQTSRVTFEGRFFNVRNTSDYGEHHFYMSLMCEEGVAQ
jgi:SPP1 family predicted phage head-tail adaptor